MNKKSVVREVHVPKAENIRKESDKKVLIDWIDKVEKAKNEKLTDCYVVASVGGITKYVVQKFLDAGYDLYYNHFMHDGSWFVKAHWEDGCCGRIFDETKREYVDINIMFTY